MTVHVIGAGVAGLVAALRLAESGHVVLVHESSPQAGGRCRALPDGSDNGTHALIGGNRAALGFLDHIGALPGWVEPEPEGLPVLDLATGRAARVALSPLDWVRPELRPAGLSMGALLALARLALPLRDRPVAEVMAAHPEFHRGFVDPLVIAALNTPSTEASSRRLGAVLRRLRGRQATRLLVARDGLGPDLVAPALAALERAGASIRFGARLRRLACDRPGCNHPGRESPAQQRPDPDRPDQGDPGLVQQGGRASALDFGEEVVPLGPEDAVVLAVPPWEAQRLLPDLPVPAAHSPIVNLHFAHRTPGPVRFLGLLDALCQWVLVRPTGVSVTVSTGDAAAAEEPASLAPRAWAELRRAALAFGVAGDWPEAVPPCRVVKERRATPRHLPGPPPRPPRWPLPNLVLAGDWTVPDLPATIEASVLSGEAAARAIGPRRSASPVKRPA